MGLLHLGQTSIFLCVLYFEPHNSFVHRKNITVTPPAANFSILQCYNLLIIALKNNKHIQTSSDPLIYGLFRHQRSKSRLNKLVSKGCLKRKKELKLVDDCSQIPLLLRSPSPIISLDPMELTPF